jgi:tripartite-type tricarboxylate transporter receptor subunit TctC
MIMNVFKSGSVAVFATLTSLAVGACFAQDTYPSQPITIVVPYAPGGQGDVMARLVGERLSAEYKQPVVVENRAGASARIGTKRVAESQPDGYTLLMGQTGEIAVNSSVFPTLEYDPRKDLRPVVLVADAPLVLATSSKTPYSDLTSLLAAAKKAPGTISYASTGNATPGRLASAALALRSDVDLLNVPYKSAGQVITDMLGRHVDLFFVSTSAFRPHQESGSLKALAVASSKRTADLPHVPAIAESVNPDFSYTLWAGLFAPANTPDAIVNKLNQSVNRIMADPALRQRLEADGSAVPANTPAEFGKFVEKEIEKYAVLVKETGIQAE